MFDENNHIHTNMYTPYIIETDRKYTHAINQPASQTSHSLGFFSLEMKSKTTTNKPREFEIAAYKYTKNESNEKQIGTENRK